MGLSLTAFQRSPSINTSPPRESVRESTITRLPIIVSVPARTGLNCARIPLPTIKMKNAAVITVAGMIQARDNPKPGAALSLSSMPRLRDTPNGFNEWLVCEAIAWARDEGLARVSLNFSPFAALLAPEADLNALQRVERRALLSLKGHFQLDNLLLFNRKFFPSWERRFVVYERRRDLPRVGIAALVAEAYLPFSGRRP